MSGLAEIMINLGYVVSGSDRATSNLTERLKSLGAVFSRGHNRRNVQNANLVVMSTAIGSNNVEVKEAKKKRIPVITRGDLLADLVRMKPNAIAVAGSHGKTTTTSMIAAILDKADISSTMIVGGVLRRKGRSARWGHGSYLVTETDEHDGSFLKLAPTVSVVTNIDEEHLAHYGTFANIKEAFFEFIHKVPFYGFSVLCRDDPNIRKMMPRLSVPYVTYGLDRRSDLYPTQIRITKNFLRPQISFQVHSRSLVLGRTGKLGAVRINAFGMHNVLNTLASIAVGLGLRIPFRVIQKGLGQFGGVERRLQIKKIAHGCVLIEDYAHHPTEIRATFRAIRLMDEKKNKRLIVIFQPHLFSRTKQHMQGFVRELSGADVLFVTDIYPAREKPIKGITARRIVEGIKNRGNKKIEVYYIHNKEKIPDHVFNILRKDDVVLVMGAGNIYTVTDKIARMLELQGL